MGLQSVFLLRADFYRKKSSKVIYRHYYYRRSLSNIPSNQTIYRLFMTFLEGDYLTQSQLNHIFVLVHHP